MRAQELLTTSLIVAGILLSAANAPAQDVIVTRTQTFRGRVISVDETGIHIQLSIGGEVTIPRATVVQLTVEPPPSVVKGLAAYEKGDLRDAQLNLAKIMTNYRGLDTGWVTTGLVYFGRASLRAGDYDQASKAFATFLQTYPEHPLGAAVGIGQAQLELARKNFAPALARFQELAEPYDQQLKPPREELAYAAEIHLGMGQCEEGLTQPEAALKEYYRVIGLYAVEPYCSEALYRAAMLLLKSKQRQKAEKMLSELIESYPASPFAAKALEARKALGAVRAE